MFVFLSRLSFFYFVPNVRFSCPICVFFGPTINCLLIFSRLRFFFVPWRFFCPATARGGALDWLFDRINLDPKIQIKHVESNNQLADILTEGNFTRDEWNHLLHLFDIMSNTTFTCSHFFVPKRKQSVATSKRSQESFSTDDSPTFKARSRTFTVVSKQCWSAKQRSSTSNSTIPGSTRTAGVSSSIGNHCLKARQKFQCWALKLMADGCACRVRCSSGSVVVCTVREAERASSCVLVFDVAHTVPVSGRLRTASDVRRRSCSIEVFDAPSRVRGNRLVLECLC